MGKVMLSQAFVILFRGVCIPTMPWEGRPPQKAVPPQKADCSRRQTPLQDTDTAKGYSQQAGRTHPTGMHPC